MSVSECVALLTRSLTVAFPLKELYQLRDS